MTEYIEPVTDAIRDLGFPIVVSIYFMVLHAKRLDRMQRQLERLVVATEVLANLGEDE